MLVDRPFVCDKLALSRWQSYMMFPATKSGYLRDADIIERVNSVRSRNLPQFTFIPGLVTAETLEEQSGVPVRKLKLWARRKRNPIPHIRFNSHVLRFPAQASQWLEENSR